MITETVMELAPLCSFINPSPLYPLDLFFSPLIVFLTFRAVWVFCHRLVQERRIEVSGILDACEYVLLDLAATRGFIVRHLEEGIHYLPEDGVILEVRGRLRATLTIRISRPFLVSAFFRNVPVSRGHHFFLPNASRRALRQLVARPGFHEVMDYFGRTGFSVAFTPGELGICKRLHPGEIFAGTFANHLRLAQDLAKICVSVGQIPVQALAGARHCAYCKEPFQALLPVVLCSSCGTPHHSECFRLHGGCAVFGCRRSVASREARAL